MKLEKEAVFRAAMEHLHNRLQELTQEQKAVSESFQEEVKSSAGDKYETGREMLTQSLRQVEGQLELTRRNFAELLRIQQVDQSSSQVGVGSLVRIAGVYFLVSIPLGKIEVNGASVYLVSMESPLGQALSGKKQKEPVLFRGKEHRLELLK